tara:strand:+ start:3122 stop:4207 length:1086 start_codon:yes stop_codon:yes gene_type:complete
MNKIFYRYIIKEYFKIFTNVLLIFVCLTILLSIFDEIEFFKFLNVSLLLPISLTFLSIPNLILELLPFVVFLSSMWYFVGIKSNKDLLSLKVFGFSNLKIISILTMTMFIFGVFVLVLVNPITSLMVKQYEYTKAKYSRDIDHLVSINKNGVWIKETIENSSRIIEAEKLEDNFLINVSVYNIDNNGAILERIESKIVDIKTKNWIFKDALIFRKNEDYKKKDLVNYEINSNFDSEKILSLYKNLDTVSFISLLTDYEKLLDQGYKKISLDEKLNVFFSLPIFLSLMILLSSIFTIGSLNKSQNLYYVIIAIITCIVIFYFKDLSIALGKTNRISQILAVWIPVISISLFCSIGIIQINEK